MTIKVVFDPVSRTTWLLRLVCSGDCYGCSDAVRHENTAPLVEFFDTRFPHTPLGQFVSRYYASTLLEAAPFESAFVLDGGNPQWQVSAPAMASAIAWLQEVVAERADAALALT